ncbi:transcriptional regulator [Bifidobacterium sp. ESL0732]|uniref:winged helix-turn-helix domain-containing protein n=1 Tax=Bifidobacterium sp. ESL0732 TaxID=2983222 RepID=UPI0023F7576A|nr:transcriptional regulator [Bifidobacterium sp. ESL0732]WEV64115.1 transcriptional regulator [Bifidobacterium sp. ESL0732]
MSEQLNPVIHAPSRLRIMTTLTSLNDDESISFTKLKQLLNMTNGNLSVHLTKLEEADYVSIDKTFEGRKPVTYVSVTSAGRDAFATYLHDLQALLKPATDKTSSPKK